MSKTHLSVTGLLAAAVFCPAADPPTFTYYPVPMTASRSDNVPVRITLGPDLKMWFTQGGGDPKIGTIDPAAPAGTSTRGFDAIQGIGITSANGRLWFTDGVRNKIYSIDTNGMGFQPLSNQPNNAWGWGNGIITAPAPDGNLWFTQTGTGWGGIYGMIPRATGLGEGFASVPWNAPSSWSGLDRITIGPDGNLWLPEGSFGGFAKFDMGTRAFTQYDITLDRHNIPAPTAIATGPDGRLWSSSSNPCSNQSAIVAMRIEDALPKPGVFHANCLPGTPEWNDLNGDGLFDTTARGITYYTTSNSTGQRTEVTGALTTGPDGYIWATGRGADGNQAALIRISTRGAFTVVPFEDPKTSPRDITNGSNECLWITDGNPGHTQIIKTCLPGPKVVNLTAPSGNYHPGDTVKIDVTFDKEVEVIGDPKLVLNTGEKGTFDRLHSTPRILRFNYTVGYLPPTLSLPVRLDAASTAPLRFMNFGGPVMALELNDGSIRDIPGNDAILLVPVAPASGALATTTMVNIYAFSPETPITIDSSPSGLSFTVSGSDCRGPGPYTSPQTLNWATGAPCTVNFVTPQSGGPHTQYAFTAWAGGDASNPRIITTPASATTYIANFKTRYELTAAVGSTGAGAVSGADYYDAGSSALITATPSSNYRFANWTGPVASPSSASTTVTMTGPVSVTANFQLKTTTEVAAAAGNTGTATTLKATVGPIGFPFIGSLQFLIDGTNVGSTIPIFGAGQYSLSYTVAVGPGPHTISAVLTSTDPSVAGSSGTNTLTVQTTPTITWPPPAPITYGTPLSSTQLNATCSVPGTLAYTPATGTVLPPGLNQTLSVTCAPTDATNYNNASTARSIDVLLPTATTVEAASGQYSDPVSISANVSAAVGSFVGTLQFQVDGTNVGPAIPVTGSGVYRTGYVISKPAGSYTISATFTPSTPGVLPSSGTRNLTVSTEDAAITPSSGLPQAVIVDASGNATSIVFTATLSETPDGSPGDISNGQLRVTLVPALANAAKIVCSAVQSGGTWTATCANVPVEAYTVQWRITGSYYQGAADTLIAVYDPSLGSVTGSGSVANNGVSADFALSLKYQKDGSLIGGLAYVEHRPGGDLKVSTTALTSMSIVDGNTAVILGYASVNGAGSYPVQAIVTDNGEPGKNHDMFGLKLTNAPVNPIVSFDKVTITEGNIKLH